MSYSTGTLAGKYLLLDGSPASGTIEIIPSVARILDADGDVILSGRAKPVLDAAGAFSIDLPATDDATLNPAGVTYTVVARLRHAHLPAVTGVALPAGEVLQVADIDSGVPGAPVYAAQVTRAEFDALAADVDARVDYIAIDTDGVPYYDPLGGSGGAVVIEDTDGVPYYLIGA